MNSSRANIAWEPSVSLRVALIVVIVAQSGLTGAAQTTSTGVRTLSSTPIVVQSQQTTTLTITAAIPPSPSLIPASVQLVRYDAAGRVVARIGPMYDDGSSGDLVAGDGVFTARVVVSETGPAALYYRVSMAFRGQLLRTLSQTLTVPVAVTQPFAGVRASLATALRDRRTTDAYSLMGERLNRDRVLESVTPGDLVALAEGVDSCQTTREAANMVVCQGTVPLASGAAILNFVFVSDAYGQWRLIAW